MADNPEDDFLAANAPAPRPTDPNADYVYGIPGAEQRGIGAQFLNMFVPYRSEVVTPASSRDIPMDGPPGTVLRIPVPGEYKDAEFGFSYMPIVQGVASLFSDPVGAAQAAASMPEQIYKQQAYGAEAMMQGYDFAYDPETGQEYRYDPTLIPATTAVGTAASINQAIRAGETGTFVGMIGGKKVSSPEIQARMLDAQKRLDAGEDPDRVFAETSTAYYSYTNPTTGKPVNYLAVELDDAFNQVQLPSPLDEAASDLAFKVDRSKLDDLFEATGNNTKPDYGRFVPYSLEDFMGADHPILEYYPHLKNINIHAVESMPTGPSTLGNWDVDANTINLNMTYGAGPNEIRSTIMHEIQHAIQDFEGLPKGGQSFYPSTVDLRQRAASNDRGLRNAVNIIESSSFGDLKFGGPYTVANEDIMFGDRYNRINIADALQQAQKEIISEKGSVINTIKREFGGGFDPRLVFPGPREMTGSGLGYIPKKDDLLFKDEVVERAREKLVTDLLVRAERFEDAMATLGIRVSTGPETSYGASQDAYKNYRRIAGEGVAFETQARLGNPLRPAVILRNIDEKEAILASNPTFPLKTRFGTYESREEMEFGLEDDKDMIASWQFSRPRGFSAEAVSPELEAKVQSGEVDMTRVDPTLSPEEMPFRIEDVRRVASETGAKIYSKGYDEFPWPTAQSSSGLLGGDKPQRFYHGTGAEFKEFDPDAPYTFVADTPSSAEYFAGDVLDGAPNIRPVYLKDANFFDVDNPDHLRQLRESDFYQKNKEELDGFALDEDVDFIGAVEAGRYDSIEDSGVIDWMRSNGFDGFTTYEQDGKNYAVFDVNNIVPGVVKKKEGGVISLVDVARNMNRGPRGVGSLAPIARNMYRTMVS